jgi:hypothetical protein
VPIAARVEAENLFGLAEIIADIESISGARFSVAATSQPVAELFAARCDAILAFHNEWQ